MKNTIHEEPFQKYNRQIVAIETQIILILILMTAHFYFNNQWRDKLF